MNKRNYLLLMMTVLVMAFCLSACGKSDDKAAGESKEATTEVVAEVTTDTATEDSESDYAGAETVEKAVYDYVATVMSKDYEKTDVTIPSVIIVYKDESKDNDIVVYGDFWVYNYNIKGDTLECESGGNYPGLMHVKKDGDLYKVTSVEIAADGEDFDKSAKELFGDHYDDFMKVYSDSDRREKIRKKAISDYVRLHDLKVTKYKDYGWDPVELDQ